MNKLRSDERGGIAVLGILMGTVLVAALFHLASSGFAIMWRETVQDAADATAYEAALWNARGMNIISAVNIFIAVVMAVLMLWRLIILFMFVLTVLLAVACPFTAGGTCAAASATGNISIQMLRQDARVAGRVYQVIRMLHDTQKVVAAATPVMGTLSSATEAARYNAEFGIGFGTQLIPTTGYALRDKPSKGCSARQRRRTDRSGNWGDLLGKPVSLPVTSANDLSRLCQQGGKMQIMMLWYIVGKVGENFGLDFLSKLGQQSGGGNFGRAWGAVAGTASDFLCGNFMGVVGSLGNNAVSNRCGSDQSCQDGANANRSTAMDDIAEASGWNPGNARHPLELDTSHVRWARVWDLAANGNLFMQSWGFVRMERGQLNPFDRGLHIADLSRRAEQEGDGTEQMGSTFAQAEMYFDCAAGWSDAECQSLAPWAMRWRARLRRVHDPLDLVESDFQSTMVSALLGGLDGRFASAVASRFGPLSDLLNQAGGRLIPVGVSEAFGAQRDEMARELAGAGQNAASRVNELVSSGRAEMIH